MKCSVTSQTPFLKTLEATSASTALLGGGDFGWVVNPECLLIGLSAGLERAVRVGLNESDFQRGSEGRGEEAHNESIKGRIRPKHSLNPPTPEMVSKKKCWRKVFDDRQCWFNLLTTLKKDSRKVHRGVDIYQLTRISSHIFFLPPEVVWFL